MTDPDTRARLLSATLDVIGETGLESATIKQIASRAGCNHGLVHYYFRNKEELLVAAIEVANERYAARFRALAAGLSRGRLAHEAFALAAHVLRSDAKLWGLQAEIVALGLRRPDLRQTVAAVIGFATDRTAELVARARGRSAPDDDDRQTGALIRAAFDGFAVQAAFDPEFDLDRAIGTLASLLHQPVFEEPPH